MGEEGGTRARAREASESQDEWDSPSRCEPQGGRKQGHASLAAQGGVRSGEQVTTSERDGRFWEKRTQKRFRRASSRLRCLPPPARTRQGFPRAVTRHEALDSIQQRRDPKPQHWRSPGASGVRALRNSWMGTGARKYTGRANSKRLGENQSSRKPHDGKSASH